MFKSTSVSDFMNHSRLIVHEMGHALINALGINGNNFDSDLLRPVNSDGIIGTTWPDSKTSYHFGYAGGHYSWQFGKDSTEDNRYREEIADMFVGWTYHRWGNNDLGQNRASFMNTLMVDYLP